MSRTKKLTLSSMIAALCVAALGMTAFIPRITLALTAMAGIFPAAAIVACGFGWGAGVVVVTGILGFLLLPDKTAIIWFVLFFGHYPFWKLAAERLQIKLGKAWVGWLLKIAGFLLCMLLLYFLFHAAFAAAIPVNLSGIAFLAAAMAILCVCFVFYDVAYSILIGYFRIRILPRVK